MKTFARLILLLLPFLILEACQPNRAPITYPYPPTTGHPSPAMNPAARATWSRRELRQEARLLEQQAKHKIQEGKTMERQARKLKGNTGKEIRREGHLLIVQGRLMKKQAHEMRKESKDRK